MPLMTLPRIFLSATSREFGSARRDLSGVLVRLGFMPVYQDIAGTESGDLLGVLRKKIDACLGLVHIVGFDYGAEPRSRGSGMGRVSYTQFEYLYARSRRKKTWIVVADDA